MPRARYDNIIGLLTAGLLLNLSYTHASNCFFSRGIRRFAQVEASNAGRNLLQTSAPQCASSWLGYQCTQLVCGRIRMHWSLGGAAPTNGCSYVLNGNQATTPDASSQLLHIALQTDITGYVATSWPKFGGMAPADAVIGYVTGNGSASIHAYAITGYHADDVQPDMAVEVTATAAEMNATALTICFTRNLSQVGKAAGVAIQAASIVKMHFVASSNPLKQEHHHSMDYQCGSVSVTLLRTPGGPDDGGWRPSNETSNAVVAEAIEEERLGYMRAHGALEFTGWIVLVPLGILAARHRWLFSPVSFVGMWFQVHRASQIIAVVLVVTGFILPWTTFNSNEELAITGGDEHHMKGDSLLEAHERLAICLITVLGLHVVLAIARPKPDASWRWAWNLIHWWTGRGLALLAGINVTIGIALWRRVSGGSGVEWIIPLVVFAAGWLGVAVWLERRAPEDRGRDGGGAVGDSVDGTGLTVGVPSSSHSRSSAPGEVPMSRLAASLGSNANAYTKL